MKKSIFISLTDFLKAGGKTQTGMRIYREMPIKPMDPSEDNSMIENSAFLGELKQPDADTDSNCYLLTNNSFKSFPISPVLMYVKVEVIINV